MTFTGEVADPPGVVGRGLALVLLGRVPALADELLKCVVKEGEAGGGHGDIYGEGGLVPLDDLYQSLRGDLEFILGHLGRPGGCDLAVPRRTGRRRAGQGAPLAVVQGALQAAFRFAWDALVAEARRSGVVPDADLVGIASQVQVLHGLAAAELAAAYRDVMAERVLGREQARSAGLEALLGGRIADIATVWEAADLLGLPYRGVFVVVAAEVPGLAGPALPRVQGRLRGRGIGSAWQLLPEFEVGIVSLRSPGNLPVLAEVLRSGAAARVGVSPVYAGLERTPQALHLARIALAGSPAGGAGVTVFDDAPLPVLVASSPAASARVVTAVLGPLLDISPDERDMLLETLAAFFACRGSAAEAGRRLYCHPNTVRHRLHRIERQTGRALNDPRSSAELFVALQALRTLPGPVDAPGAQGPDRAGVGWRGWRGVGNEEADEHARGLGEGVAAGGGGRGVGSGRAG